MSTEWIFDPVVPEVQFLAAAKQLGYTPDYTLDKATKTYYPVGADGNYLWVSVYKGNVNLTRFGRNNDEIIDEFAEILGVSAWHEETPEFHAILDADENEEHGQFVRFEL